MSVMYDSVLAPTDITAESLENAFNHSCTRYTLLRINGITNTHDKLHTVSNHKRFQRL